MIGIVERIGTRKGLATTGRRLRPSCTNRTSTASFWFEPKRAPPCPSGQYQKYPRRKPTTAEKNAVVAVFARADGGIRKSTYRDSRAHESAFWIPGPGATKR